VPRNRPEGSVGNRRDFSFPPLGRNMSSPKADRIDLREKRISKTDKLEYEENERGFLAPQAICRGGRLGAKQHSSMSPRLIARWVAQRARSD